MRLVCNGVALDLKSGATLSFKKVNPLFAFDALTCERTQSFDIPATPHNEAVFELSKLPAFNGDSMRRRFDCELQDGTVVKHGFLYVDTYTNGAYKGVFVTGELLGLLKIKNAGKIAEISSFESNLQWVASNAKDANTNDARNNEFEMIRYKDAHAGVPFPSVLAHEIAKRCARDLGVTVSGWPSQTKFMRLLPPELKGFENIPITVKSEQYAEEVFQDTVDVNISTSTLNTILQPSRMAFMYPLYRFVIEPPHADSWWQDVSDPGNRHTIAGWRAMVDVDIKLPDDLPTNMFMVEQIPPTYTRTWENWRPAVFYGDYWFGQGGAAYGTPLRGRTVRVEKGKQFCFISNEDWRLLDADRTKYHDGQLVDASWWEHNGEKYLEFGQPGYEYRLEVSQANEIVDGEKVFEIGTLPDMTLIDLFKAIASISGTALNYDDENGLTFDPVSVDTWPTLEIKHVINEDGIMRKFGKYAQRNIVKFNSSKSVFSGEKLTTAYTVVNENLEEENILHELPFSECGLSFDANGNPVAYIRGNESDGTTDNWSVMLANENSGSEYMSRVYLSKNAGIQQLCNASTSLTIKIRMTLAKYESVQAKTALLYNGTRYVWTEATWQNNVCTCKISKI